jgi:hypothetical protein
MSEPPFLIKKRVSFVCSFLEKHNTSTFHDRDYAHDSTAELKIDMWLVIKVTR